MKLFVILASIYLFLAKEANFKRRVFINHMLGIFIHMETHMQFKII